MATHHGQQLRSDIEKPRQTTTALVRLFNESSDSLSLSSSSSSRLSPGTAHANSRQKQDQPCMSPSPTSQPLLSSPQQQHQKPKPKQTNKILSWSLSAAPSVQPVRPSTDMQPQQRMQLSPAALPPLPPPPHSAAAEQRAMHHSTSQPYPPSYTSGAATISNDTYGRPPPPPPPPPRNDHSRHSRDDSHSLYSHQRHSSTTSTNNSDMAHATLPPIQHLDMRHHHRQHSSDQFYSQHHTLPPPSSSNMHNAGASHASSSSISSTFAPTNGILSARHRPNQPSHHLQSHIHPQHSAGSSPPPLFAVQSSQHPTHHLATAPPLPQPPPPPPTVAATSTPASSSSPSYITHGQPYGYANGNISAPPMPAGMSAGSAHYATVQSPMNRAVAGSSDRHKKEIKRRTKTGCLTCRKRRIKCDEAQPTCRNCVKSKRECLGYDPMYKPEPPSPPIINAPLNYNHQLSQPTSLPLSTPHHLSDPSSSHSVHTQPYPPPAHPWPSYIPPSVRDSPAIDQSFGHSSLPSHGGGMGPSRPNPALRRERKVVESITIDDLFVLNDVPPQYQRREPPPPLSVTQQRDIGDFYHFHFANGLNAMLETNWYTTQAYTHLQQHAALQDYVAQCADAFKARMTDPSVQRLIASLEARLVWQLACLPRLAARGPAGHQPAVQELLRRLDVLENLLTGKFLESHRLPLPPQPRRKPNDPNEAALEQQQLFWHHLGRFVSARDDLGDVNVSRELYDALESMRKMLGVWESRDVLYSFAIGRHVGGRMPTYHPYRDPANSSTNDDNDDVNRLKVAHTFIKTEASEGSSQVIQAMCNMAFRSWALAKK